MRLICYLWLLFIGLCLGSLSDVPQKLESHSNPVSERSIQSALLSQPFHKVNMSLIPVEEQDAMVVEYLLTQSFKSVRVSIRVVSNVIRIIADTAAGAASTFVKGFGGLVNLLSSFFARCGVHLQNSTTPIGMKTSANCNRASIALRSIGDVCIWSGDTLEEMTRGMGEALQVSFGSLEAVTKSLNHLVILLLARDHPTPYISDEDPPSTAANYTKEEYEELLKQQNSLYSRQHDRSNEETLNEEPSAEAASGSAFNSKSGLHKLHPKKSKHTDKKFPRMKTAEDLQEEPPTETPSTTPHATFVSRFVQEWEKIRTQISAYYHLVHVYLISCVSKYTSSSAATMDVPSIGPYLLIALLVMCIVNLIEYSSIVWRLLVLLLSMGVLWFHIMSVEHNQRLRLVQRTSVKSIHSYLTRQTAMHATNVSTTANSTAAAMALKRSSRSHKYQTSPLPYENSVWLNVLLSSLWNVDGPLGVREYVNSVYEEMLALEMSKISPGIADIRLKKFDLGSNAPMVKGIRMRSTRDKQCVAEVLKAAQWNHGMPGSGSSDGATAGAHENDGKQQQKYIDSFLSFIAAKHQSSSSSSSKAHGSFNGHRIKDPLSQRHSLSECDQVDLDLDFNFVSHDMDIVMSMRHEDSKSVLPEISVTLSELFLSGQLSFVMQITPDYPFLGNATVFFIEHPSLDFRVSSVGGVDLSAIPMGFEWMNVTLNWILSEYTAPFNTTIDMRHTLCPSCDQPTKLTTQELIVEQMVRLQQWMLQTSDQVSEWVKSGGDSIQVLLLKSQPMWKRLQLMSIKLIDVAAVRGQLLMQRWKRIGLRLEDSALRLPDTNMGGVGSVGSSAFVPQKVAKDVVSETKKGSTVHSKGLGLIELIRNEITSLPQKANHDDWWDDMVS